MTLGIESDSKFLKNLTAKDTKATFANFAVNGFQNLNPETILAIKGQKATKNIIPDPIQSTIINCLRVSGYLR
jgi:hypothetical protein